jgi:hypothetical protein
VVRQRIHPFRFTVVTAGLLGVCAGLVLLVRVVTPRAHSIPVVVLAGVLFTLIPSSVLEWLVHRYIYHRRRFGPLAQIFRIHHRGHHAAIFPTWRYTTNGEVRRHPISEPDVSHLYPAGWRNWISKAAHFLFYMAIGFVFILTPAWWLTRSALFSGTVVVSLAVLSDLFVRVHDAIHYPGQFKLVEAQPWFPFIDRHHFIHHVDMEANVNFLLPLADWCYGTLRTSLSESETAKHGTLAQAKANPVGHSEPAAVFAAEVKAARD